MDQKPHISVFQLAAEVESVANNQQKLAFQGTIRHDKLRNNHTQRMLRARTGGTAIAGQIGSDARALSHASKVGCVSTRTRFQQRQRELSTHR